MSDYIKLFDEHTDYVDYTQDSDFTLPNVSHCIEEDDVHYNPLDDERLTIIYKVIDDTVETSLYGHYEQAEAVNMFSKIEIDGVEVSPSDLDDNEGYYQLSYGLHTVKYTLLNPTIIGYVGNAFDGCTTIVNVIVPKTVTTITDHAFTLCHSLEKIIIPGNVTTIDGDAFLECDNLNYVLLNEGFTTLDSGAFRRCVNLKHVMLPSTLTTIGNGVFNDCISLSKITISENVTTIGDYAFADCSSLSSVRILATTPPTLGTDAFDNVAIGFKIYVPSASVATYKAASGWSDYASDIEAI